jgi:hypothetical protein
MGRVEETLGSQLGRMVLVGVMGGRRQRLLVRVVAAAGPLALANRVHRR